MDELPVVRFRIVDHRIRQDGNGEVIEECRNLKANSGSLQESKTIGDVRSWAMPLADGKWYHVQMASMETFARMG